MSVTLSVIISAASAVLDFIGGALADNNTLIGPVGGAILFAFIAGTACIIKAIGESGKK